MSATPRGTTSAWRLRNGSGRAHTGQTRRYLSVPKYSYRSTLSLRRVYDKAIKHTSYTVDYIPTHCACALRHRKAGRKLRRIYIYDMLLQLFYTGRCGYTCVSRTVQKKNKAHATVRTTYSSTSRNNTTVTYMRTLLLVYYDCIGRSSGC